MLDIPRPSLHTKHRRRRNFEASEVKDAVEQAGTVFEACRILHTTNRSVYRAMERFGIPRPMRWRENHLFRLGTLRKQSPTSILGSPEARMWVGLMIGTECGLQASYEEKGGHTRLKISLGMTDRVYVARFAELCGVSPPRLARSKSVNNSDVWSREVTGLRAIIILKEALPYLLGEKRRQAERALEFFSPTGYRRGRFSSRDVWPRPLFPIRKGPRHVGS